MTFLPMVAAIAVGIIVGELVVWLVKRFLP
jgi:hypothetical protein